MRLRTSSTTCGKNVRPPRGRLSRALQPASFDAFAERPLIAGLASVNVRVKVGHNKCMSTPSPLCAAGRIDELPPECRHPLPEFLFVLLGKYDRRNVVDGEPNTTMDPPLSFHVIVGRIIIELLGIKRLNITC